MKKGMDLVARGREIIAIERDAVEAIEGRLDARFEKAVRLLYNCKGKVILTGVGKSGNIAQKIVATLNSTGTPAFYLHPSDALHGDLGMVLPVDVVIILSKSGDTPELAQLLPILKKMGVKIIALTGNVQSRLGRQASVVLDCSVDREACPFDLAPTASTTAMLAMGDAVAVSLYELKGFTRDDFATTHPGGAIGRRLLLKLEDMMKVGDAIPQVGAEALFQDVVLEMSRKRLGATLVTKGTKLLGIVTDGDLRRLLQQRRDFASLIASEMMTKNPTTGTPDMLGSAALMLLEEKKRMHLPVVDARGRLRGIVHMHDLIEAGLKP